MTVYNKPQNNNINDEVVGSATSVMEKTIIKENDISLSTKRIEIEDEALFCFVLGYN